MGAGGIFELIAAVSAELTLFAAVGVLVGGIDDLAVDGLWISGWLRGRWRDGVATREIDPDMPPIAIFVPAWREAGVIGTMLRTTLHCFDGHDFRLYVGCYPNDPETQREIASVADRDARVRMVVTDRNGGTTKGHCLNCLWREMRREEAAEGRCFAGVLLHDAEDLVHPRELALIVPMLADHDLVQLPVLPVINPDSPWIEGHYADEFAEMHGKDMCVRQWLGAGLPAAGVGCAISRAMLDRIAADFGGLPFYSQSLTEDYELGLRIAERGGRSAFVRMRDPDDGALVAVREHFPSTIDAAVRQKARWVVGIAYIGWDSLGWRGGIAEAWMRLRDRRAPLAAAVLTCAYASLVLHVVLTTARALGVAIEAPPSPFLEVAMQIGLGLLGWRLGVRTYFTGRAYGWSQVPIAPCRVFVSNVIAMVAAPRALRDYILVARGAQLRWDKTEHVFPDQIAADRCG